MEKKLSLLQHQACPAHTLSNSQFHHTAHEAHNTLYTIANLATSHNLDSLKYKYYTVCALYGQNLLCCHYTGLCLLTVQRLCAVSLRLAEDFAVSGPSVWEIHTTRCMLDMLIHLNCTRIDSYGLIFFKNTAAHVLIFQRCLVASSKVFHTNEDSLDSL